MALMPNYLRLRPDLEAKLAAIRQAAKERHERARKAAKAQGRVHFPDLPYESSWAYEQEFHHQHVAYG